MLKSDYIHHECPGETSTMDNSSERDSFSGQPFADSEMTQYDEEVIFSEDMNRGKEQNAGHNSLGSNDIGHECAGETSMMDNSSERDPFPVQPANKCLHADSEMTQHDADVIFSEDMNKGKEQNAGHNSSGSNNMAHECVGETSMLDNSSERDSFSGQPLNKCLYADSEMTQYDAEVMFSKDMNRGKEQNSGNNSSGNNDIGHDLQESSGYLSMDINNIRTSTEVGMTSVSETAAQISNSPKHVDFSSVKKYEDLDELGYVSLEVTTYSRKRSKVSDPQENSLGIIEEVSSPSHSRSRNASLDRSIEVLAASLIENVLEREVVDGDNISPNVVEDVILEKGSGDCSDLEHATCESNTRVEMDNAKKRTNEDSSAEDLSVMDIGEQYVEQAKRAKLNLFQDLVHDTCSVGENSYESTRLGVVDTASEEAYSKDENVDQKRESNVQDAIPSLAQLDTVKVDANQVLDEDNHSQQILKSTPERARTSSFRKKLLVLDVNGILVDIAPFVPLGYDYDAIIAKKAVFKRPFADDFLRFCFERFNVGVWSSRTKRNVQLIIDFLMGETKQKLLFCWDQSHCTWTGFNTVENREKPLLLKELKKLWEKHEWNLPWVRGQYNESNTLLLDDSPAKALLNPPYTAIFPYKYQYRNWRRDNSLGPGGDLRVYLEGLSSAENVQKYVEQNPFGQRHITKTNLSWRFYLKVISATSSEPVDDDSNVNRET